MKKIVLNEQQKAFLISKLQTYFENELDYDLGQFDADFLLDFIAQHFGVYYYNQGINDAQQVISEKVELINDALYEIEQVTPV
ncbi:DUF2164 domain-containing protein [Flocculibacter collagenilyticus]|uniref:DUF2164 domain-containing protein n=1 Tax=Flocculibacter collagenilyticus TaxID=2744479 RepID=UPI0018F50CF5|nr:DUF2164 domain-containing protein [Flocculibacter collagenilyticus]